MKRLGVIGTMVWDTIVGRDPAGDAIEEWGGIAYALAALEASLPDGWEILPLVKVGRDLAGPADDFLGSLTHRSAAGRFVQVPERNNHVLLRYEDDARRCERLTGGVPPWRWDELGPMTHDLDALYVNFISGFEMTLQTASYLRRGFQGPIYADLHSLFLGLAADGHRIPRALAESAGWFSCFDAVQLNEDEMSLLGPDPLDVAARAHAAGVGLLVVTLGERGAVYFARNAFRFGAGWPATSTGPLQTSRIPAPIQLEHTPGDPTGCGDVFGGTLTAGLLAGHEVEAAIRNANRQAARNFRHRGATNLHHYLKGGLAPT